MPRQPDSSPATIRDAIFRREGTFWTFAFDGVTVQLSDQKGFHDLARLIASPGEEIHCLELAERPREDGGPVLDERARRDIRHRVRELQQEIDEAIAAGHETRAGQAREELDQIAEMLAGALGLRGRARTIGSGAERAVGRHVADQKRDRQNRRRPLTPGSTPGQFGQHRHVLLVPAGSSRRLDVLATLAISPSTVTFFTAGRIPHHCNVTEVPQFGAVQLAANILLRAEECQPP